MSKSLLGEIVESSEVKSIRQAEVRYSLTGRYVQFGKDVAYVFNATASRMGIKGVKENVIFQAIFDQAAEQYFNPNPVIELPFSNGKAWRLNVAEFGSVEEFHQQVESLKSSLSPNSDETVDDGQLDLIEAAAATDAEIDELDAEAATDAELEEEDELEKLRREMEA